MCVPLKVLRDWGCTHWGKVKMMGYFIDKNTHLRTTAPKRECRAHYLMQTIASTTMYRAAAILPPNGRGRSKLYQKEAPHTISDPHVHLSREGCSSHRLQQGLPNRFHSTPPISSDLNEWVLQDCLSILFSSPVHHYLQTQEVFLAFAHTDCWGPGHLLQQSLSFLIHKIVQHLLYVSSR